MPLAIGAGEQPCAQPGMQIVIIVALVHKLLTVQYGLQAKRGRKRERGREREGVAVSKENSRLFRTYLHRLRLEEQHTRRCALPDAIDANACAPELLHADNAIKELCK